MYYDPKRKAYNLGVCKSLKGSVYALVIYLDDDVSQWSHTEISYGCAPKLREGLGYLERKAKSWGTKLEFGYGNYYTDYSEGTVVRYKGCVEGDILNKPCSADILGQAAKSVGFSSVDEFHKFIKGFSGKEQIMYFLVLNKDGKSYAMSDRVNDGKDTAEYCVIFAKAWSETYELVSSAVAHETLHLFGAEDYYDPYHKYPKRKVLAEKLYPKDIMLNVYYDVNESTIGGFTAYTVGWIDKIPKECDVPEWWE